jgi:uncharacterized protein
MRRPGLDADGFIAREGDLARVPPAFAPVVGAARSAVLGAFGPRLHSAYLYGSMPRGTAVPGVSDLDVLLALRGEPGDADRAAARRLEDALDTGFPEINGAGIELASTATLLSDLERYDLGWMVACLCTPLAGEDLAARLPRYRPTPLLARETNGDLGDLLPGWQERLRGASTDAELRALARRVTRRVVRTGFTLVMPRWGGWTSDLEESAAVFGRYYPAHRAQMRAAAAAARAPAADRPLLAMLAGDLGPWLAAEYLAVHGRKAPRARPPG